jgi:DNA-binding NarL/FixJ family response regulator
VLRRRRNIPALPPRQWQLLRLIDAGYSNTQLARRLNITQNTVRTYLEHIYQRLEVSSRTAALARAFPERAHTTG